MRPLGCYFLAVLCILMLREWYFLLTICRATQQSALSLLMMGFEMQLGQLLCVYGNGGEAVLCEAVVCVLHDVGTRCSSCVLLGTFAGKLMHLSVLT